MRFVPFASTVAGFCLMVLSVPTGLAQGGVSISSGFAGSFGMPGLTGMPYTASRKTTRVQKLADGTTITKESTEKEARDSNGRTYHENRIEFPGGMAGQTGFSVVTIFDPVNRATTNWNTNSKQATVFHIPEPGQMKQVQPASAVTQAQPPAIHVAQTKPEVEDLGIKTIDGLEAKGTRTTRVIPAGLEGNDRPITITNETWYCPDLKIMVASTSDDPRNGTNTMELTGIERGEPNPALFQVPEGYTVKDQNLGRQF